MERDFIFQQSIFSRTLQKERYWGRTLSNRNSGDFAEIGGGKDIKKNVATMLLLESLLTSTVPQFLSV